MMPLSVGLAAAALAFAGCNQSPTPLSTATTNTPAPSVAAAEPRVVLPVPVKTNRAPVYPKSMYDAVKPGVVFVECVVDESGHVMLATVQNSTHHDFNNTTLAAVREWTFTPGTRNGVPAAMHVVVPVEYVVAKD